MARSAWAIAVVSLAGLALATPRSAGAFGPGSHIREARTYVDSLEAGLGPEAAAGDLAILRDPDFEPFFLMGAIFPDVGRRVADMGFDPHRLDVLEGLFDLTADPAAGEEAVRAFVLGNVLHAMSDAESQVFLVPYLTAATDIGVVDVLVDQFDGPGGENEFFVEAVGDLYIGDLHGVVDLYYRLTDWSESPLDLTPVLIEYYELSEQILGPLPISPEVFADNVFALLDEISGYLRGLDPETAHSVIDGLIASGPEGLLDLIAGAAPAFLGTGEVDAGPDAIDRLARDRLMAHPFVADPDTYAIYDDFLGRLGPAFLRDSFDTRTIFSDWRTWHGPPLLASCIQSLSWRLPETFAPDPAVLLWSMDFSDETGAPLTAIALDALPAEVDAEVVAFPSTDRAANLRLEVRGDRPGLDWEADPVVGQADLQLDGLPETGAPPHRAAIRAAFDPAPTAGDVLGYYAVLFDAEVDENRPILVSFAEPYLDVPGADLTLPAWESVFESHASWQPYLPIAEPVASGTAVYLDIRVRNRRYPRQGVPGATVELRRDNTPVETVTANDVGRLTWGPGNTGAYRLVDGTASGFAWWRDTDEVATEGGDVATLTAFMEPVPVVVGEPAYTADPTRIRGRVADLRFAATQPFEAAVGMTADAPADGWAPTRRALIDLPLDPPGEDGDVRYLFARAVSEDDPEPGPVGASGPIVVDASPPVGLEIEVADLWAADAPSLDGALDASDPHSGIARFELRIASEADEVLAEQTLPGPAPAFFSLARGPELEGRDRLIVSARAVNGSGLKSPEARLAIAVELGPSALDEEPDAGPAEPLVDTGPDAFDEAGADVATGTPGEDGCGCRLAGRGIGVGWGTVALALVLAVRRRGGCPGRRRGAARARANSRRRRGTRAPR